MNRLRLTLLITLLLAFLPFLPQMPGRIATHMPKAGVVIDDGTGDPMPNVIVIAAGWSSQGPVLFGPGGYSDLYRIATFTDDDGRYKIPSTWTDAIIGVPGFDPRTGWAITVFKPGYAVVGDENAWLFHSDGSTIYRAASVSAAPNFSYRDTVIEVAPIRMFKPTLSLKEAAVYYSDIQGIGGSYIASNEPGDVAIRQLGYELLAPWVCAMDPASVVDRLTIDTIMGFSIDPKNAIKLFKQLDPSQYRSEAHQHPKYKAGIVCKIITNGSGVP